MSDIVPAPLASEPPIQRGNPFHDVPGPECPNCGTVIKPGSAVSISVAGVVHVECPPENETTPVPIPIGDDEND